MKKTFIILIICLSNMSLFAQGNTMKQQTDINKNYFGYYYGNLVVATNELPILLELKENQVLFSSPAQGANDIDVSYSFSDENNIKIEASQYHFSIEGVIDQNMINGVFHQSGMDFEIKLLKTDKSQIPYLSRTQTPTSFNYKTEEVIIKNSNNNREYYGTLTTPNNNLNDTVVLFITGSGIQDRNEEIFNHKPFLVISDFLTKNGYYTLRCDDYGFHGEDITDYTTFTVKDDIEAQIKYIKDNTNIKNIILLGHSEGAIIASILANEVNAVILESGPAISGAEIYKLQVLHLLKTSNANQSTLDFFSTKIDEVISTLLDDSLSIKQKRNVVIPYITMLGSQNSEASDAAFESLSSKWYTTFLQTDPRPYIKNIKVPTLVLQGGKDTQVEEEANIPVFKELLTSDNKIIIYDSYNHLLQKCITGETSEYAMIETTIEENVLSDILEFLNSLNL